MKTTKEIIGTFVVVVSESPLKFAGSHFKCRQQNLQFSGKKVANVLTNDILVAPYGSIEQINGKKFVDSYRTLNSV